jgi:hypothetical protein
VQRARHDGADDYRAHIGASIALKFQQLMEPDRILIRRPPRIGRDPPTGADCLVLDEREDEVGVAGIDGEQHGGLRMP